MIKKFLTICLVFLSSCNSSSVKDALDLADGVSRKPIDTRLLGINAFANDARFGSVSNQFLEVRDTLGIERVRVLFAWNDQIQPSASSEPDFALYDLILSGIPAGVEALVILTGIPSWMRNSANWIAGNPRQTFAELWVKKVAERYAGNGAIKAWQVWNEPNNISDANNASMDIVDNAANYVELLAAAESILKDTTPNKAVINAATTAINQNFPDSLDYNRAMREAGALNLVDAWAIHYYGRQYENVIREDGVAEFLNSISKPIWVTESGAQGVNNQLAYGEEVWPFIKEQIPGIERIYIYQFTEATSAGVTYGLRNLNAEAPLSDLYVHLRDD